MTIERENGYELETIKTLCGSRIGVLVAKFRYKLREALALLVSVEVGFLVSYDIDSRTDILNVVRAPRDRADGCDRRQMHQALNDVLSVIPAERHWCPGVAPKRGHDGASVIVCFSVS